jgi:anti-anti-sigma regulatory factor
MKVLTKNGTKNGIKIVDIEGEIDVYTSMELKKRVKWYDR